MADRVNGDERYVVIIHCPVRQCHFEQMFPWADALPDADPEKEAIRAHLQLHSSADFIDMVLASSQWRATYRLRREERVEAVR